MFKVPIALWAADFVEAPSKHSRQILFQEDVFVREKLGVQGQQCAP
jgi:hypothetical protein